MFAGDVEGRRECSIRTKLPVGVVYYICEPHKFMNLRYAPGAGEGNRMESYIGMNL